MTNAIPSRLGKVTPAAVLTRSALLAALLAVGVSSPAGAQVLPYEIAVAENEAGRIRNLVQRLGRQNLLFQLHLGNARKSDVVATAARIDGILERLERGSPASGIPEPWAPELVEAVASVRDAWEPLRTIATASPYDYLRRTSQFLPAQSRQGDPLSLRYFDNLTGEVVTAAEQLMAAYDVECRKTEYSLCAVTTISGYSEMLIERATKESIYVFAGIEVEQNKRKLAETVQAYKTRRAENEANPLFLEITSEQRGDQGRTVAGMFDGILTDWQGLVEEFDYLVSGDTQHFDLNRVLRLQSRMVNRMARFESAVLRYTSVVYGI